MKYRLLFFIFISCTLFACLTTNTNSSTNSENNQNESPSASSPSFENPTIETNKATITVTENSLNKTLPDDVIKEIAYFGGLGGGGGGCFNSDALKPTFFSDYESLNTTIEVFSSVETDICGLSKDEKIEITLQLPDASTRNFQSSAQQPEGQSYAELDFEFIPKLHDPLGEYTLLFTGNGWTLQRKFLVIDADSPRLYLADHKLIFYKFRPEEHVRLFAYQPIPNADEINQQGQQRLIGWQEFNVDKTGELSVNVDIKELTRYVAVGDVSGQLIYRLPNYDPDYLYWSIISYSDFYCPGAANPIGLNPNQYAEVLIDKLPYFTIYQEIIGGVYTTHINKVGAFPEKSIVKLASNPSCFNESWWWSVQHDGYKYNYVQEIVGGNVVLRPISNNTLMSEPVICSGAKSTRLHVGMDAEVTASGAAPQLSLRAQPSMSAEKVHVIAAGRNIVILDGPVCMDNSYWWYIRSEQGFEGWSREGDNMDYWIDPLP